MGNKISEASVINESMRWLKTLPGFMGYKRAASPARRGEPDITGCFETFCPNCGKKIPGKRLEVEFKAPGGKITPLQAKKVAEWGQFGVATGVSYCLEDTKRILEPYL